MLKTQEELEEFIRKIVNEVVGRDIDSEINGYLFDELFGYSKAVQPKGYIISEEASHGGEGKGEDYWVVYKVLNTETNETQYIKFYGSYNSWEGTEWEGYHITTPNEKTIIVWP